MQYCDIFVNLLFPFQIARCAWFLPGWSAESLRLLVSARSRAMVPRSRVESSGAAAAAPVSRRTDWRQPDCHQHQSILCRHGDNMSPWSEYGLY